MKTTRYSDSQIMAILKQNEAGVPVPDLCREHGIVIPPLLMSVKSRGAISYSNFLGGTPPIAE